MIYKSTVKSHYGQSIVCCICRDKNPLILVCLKDAGFNYFCFPCAKKHCCGEWKVLHRKTYTVYIYRIFASNSHSHSHNVLGYYNISTLELQSIINNDDSCSSIQNLVEKE